MVGKPIKGKSFGGCIRYVLSKEDAEILSADGICIQDAASITRDFNLQRQLNPALGKAVGHTVLSWSELDKNKLTNERMVTIAQEYMTEMSITDTQYLIVKHRDRQHPHVHIIFNRVDNNGQTITDKNDYSLNTKICRQLTEAYGLHIAEGKQKVNRQQLKGNDEIKYAIYDALKEALPHVRKWDQLEEALQSKGITLQFKYRSGSKEVQGVSFEKDGVKFKGSAIDRSMSVVGIEKQLLQNQRARKAIKSEAATPISDPGFRQANDIRNIGFQETVQAFNTSIHIATEVAGLLGDLLSVPPEFHEEEDLDLWKQQVKRKIKRMHP